MGVLMNWMLPTPCRHCDGDRRFVVRLGVAVLTYYQCRGCGKRREFSRRTWVQFLAQEMSFTLSVMAGALCIWLFAVVFLIGLGGQQ